VYKLADKHTLEGIAIFLNLQALDFVSKFKSNDGRMKVYLIAWIENGIPMDKPNWLFWYMFPEKAYDEAKELRPKYNLLVEIEPVAKGFAHPRTCIKSVQQL
jgi:hypothetical protein